MIKGKEETFHYREKVQPGALKSKKIMKSKKKKKVFS